MADNCSYLARPLTDYPMVRSSPTRPTEARSSLAAHLRGHCYNSSTLDLRAGLLPVQPLKARENTVDSA